jgi:hypothetical protein
MFQFPSFEVIPIKPENLANEQYEFSIYEQFEIIKQEPYN